MLDGLPREILVLISDFLDQIQPNSVIDLACVNNNFLSICTPLLQVRTVQFSVYDDGEQLAEDILHYSQLLQHLGGFRAVRRLIIVTSDDKKVIREQMQQRRSEQQWQRPKISTLDYRGHEYDVLRKHAGKPGGPIKDKDTAHQKNRLWMPLADFILRLPRLDSIFYSSYYQIPPCILDSILRSRSQCRLYITRFALWSLGPQGITDPYELELITSPILHGIGTASTSIYGYTNQDPALREHIYLDQALRHLVSGLTPQLKNLVMIQLQPFRQPSATNNGPLLSMGFAPQADRQTSGLENLEIRDNTYPGRLHRKEDMEIWNQDIDLSILRTLKIGPKSTLEAIKYMTKTCSFLSLTSLSINPNPQSNRRHDSDYYTAMSLYLLCIPALTELELHGWHPELNTISILKHHGPRLRRLLLLARMGENISLEVLNQLGENCPLLEDLTTQVLRSRGDTQEVMKYRAIGRIPQLKRLFLKLDVSDLSLLCGSSKELGLEGADDDDEDDDETQCIREVRNDPSFNSFDQLYCKSKFIFHWQLRPRNGHIRDAFINAALDQELTKSIFQTIYLNTSGEESCPLQYLEVQAMGAGQLSWDKNSFERGFHDVLSRLGRTHCVTRNGNEEFKIEVAVTGQVFTSRPTHPYFDDQETPQILPFALQIYRRLWPPKNEQWFDDWHSFPLALSAENEIDWAKS